MGAEEVAEALWSLFGDEIVAGVARAVLDSGSEELRAVLTGDMAAAVAEAMADSAQAVVEAYAMPEEFWQEVDG